MIERVPVEEWLEFDRAFPAPTFFARPAWALALADARPHLEPALLRVKIDGDWLFVPTVRGKGGKLPFKHYIAFPMGGYTCVIDARGHVVDEDRTARTLRAIAQSVDRFHVIPWPLGPQPRQHDARSTAHETAVIDCSRGFDAVLSGIRGVTRRMAGQAERRGVSCAVASDAIAIDDYYGLLSKAAKGWGLDEPPISRPLLEAVANRGGADVEVWFAEVEGTRVGGGVVFYGSEELFFWSAAMLRDYSEYRPSNALNLALLRSACERGLHWYNLGASEGLPGVERFKRDLGATTIGYAELQWKRPYLLVYERLRDRIRRRSA